MRERDHNRQRPLPVLQRAARSYQEGLRALRNPRTVTKRELLHGAIVGGITLFLPGSLGAGIGYTIDQIITQKPPDGENPLSPQDILEESQYIGYDQAFNIIDDSIQHTTMKNSFNYAAAKSNNGHLIVFRSDMFISPYPELRQNRFINLFSQERFNIQDAAPELAQDNNTSIVLSLLYAYAGSYPELYPRGSQEYMRDQRTFALTDEVFYLMAVDAEKKTVVDFVDTLAQVYNTMSQEQLNPHISLTSSP